MVILGLKSQLTPTHQISSIIPLLTNSIRKPLFQFLPLQRHRFTHLQLKSRRKNPIIFIASNSEESNDGGGGDEAPRFNLRWSELLLDSDRDNVVAVGLTGALVWAGLQLLWHLLVVTMAVFIAAIKYTFVGVLLIFILITLL